ncbi:hypothetical protein G3480_15735 [Thiorhodococcus mannitoliphagus]|uniref:Chorismatase FkbO/Hyg5-like N-terminal domain-containing protein n=1 Tax=Thiorhodococcus mannitoliphagus TaxID=329406 RepID=A0A6P1E218_9GAMM|nr:hypothetical protein [Thiorhodococcus mannitoliphagus]NEX21745.1 hypothetical protein [Thiorhodococcus mannitoliphagus]
MREPAPRVARLDPLQPELAWKSALQLTGRDQPHSWEDLQCWEGNDLLFGTLRQDEDWATRSDADKPALEQATEAAFRAMFRCLDAKGYPHLVRVWSYLPRINVLEAGLERYRQFNIGRQTAFAASGRSLTDALPAASALGGREDGLRLGFLASRDPACSLENPRQVSAYCYPKAYGPRSPTFARAALMTQADMACLFISGTAAIMGHRSLHPGDASTQTRETIINLQAVIAEANRIQGAQAFFAERLEYLIYVRHATDLDAVAAELETWLPGHRRWHFMQADICRRELLVEIEAIGPTRHRGPSA